MSEDTLHAPADGPFAPTTIRSLEAELRPLRLLCQEQHERIRKLETEIADLKTSVVAFCGPAAREWAQEHGLPDRHLHPTHYDILARAGARMVDFVRADIPEREALNHD